MSQQIVKLALAAFKEGRYIEARELYMHAAQKIGADFFKVNIDLCNKRMSQIGLADKGLCPSGLGADSKKTAECVEAIDANGEVLSPALFVKSEKAKHRRLRALYILDQISEISWSKQFDLTQLDRKGFREQLATTKFDFLFLESCWKGNQGAWEYAFVSPNFRHANAQALLDAIRLAKERKIPIVFWNKEDPMHFEKFLPVAKHCDIVLTTDSNLLDSYSKHLEHTRVDVLGFGADPAICNPKNRFRSQPETVCFAGAYYPEHHDERVRQMDYVLPAILKFGGAIYDRYSNLQTDKYRFPEPYSSVIRPSVPFSEIVNVYKNFKVFLNVNTIIDSPTMMSRRVYELLASGTPVVSAPSRALDVQFGDLVATGTQEEEICAAVEHLLTQEDVWEKVAHRGYREVFTKHTYRHGRDTIERSLGREAAVNLLPLISIIVASCRPKNVQRTIENVIRQGYGNCEVIYVVTPNFTAEDIENLLSVPNRSQRITRAELLVLGSEVTLGKCLNEAIRISRGDYIAKFDDDNFYFENYLTDLLIPFSFDDYKIVGKESYFCYLGGMNKIIWRSPEKRHRETKFVAGDAMMIKREVFEITSFPEKRVGEDTKLLKDVVASGLKIYSADHFNFIKYRDSDLSAHTWVVEEEALLRQAKIVCDDLIEEVVKC